jgi:hypothetical protein
VHVGLQSGRLEGFHVGVGQVGHAVFTTHSCERPAVPSEVQREK